MTREEVEILLRMRDEMSSVLAGVTRNFRNAGGEVDNLGKRMDGLIKQSRQLGTALAGAFVVRRAIRDTVGAFGDFQEGLITVAKTADMSDNEMKQFESTMKDMSQTIKGVSTKELLDISQVAAQAGIEGSKNIAKFTKALAMLSGSDPTIQGGSGAELVAKILNVTGEGVDAVDNFASALVGLGAASVASNKDILQTASVVGQSAAQFHLTAAAVLGLSTAATELKMRPQLFASTFGRTMIQLQKAAIEGGQGMRVLSDATGLTQMQFKQLIDEHPEKAFTLFLSVLKRLDSETSQNSFLETFNLQSQDNQRILGSATQNVETFNKRLGQSVEWYKEAAKNVEFYNRQSKSQNSELTQLMNNFGQLGIAIGEAMAPLTHFVFTNLIDGLQGVTAAINNLTALHPAIAAMVSAFGLLVLAAVPLLATFKLIRSAMAILGTANAVKGLQMIGVEAGLATKAVGFLGLAISRILKIGLYAAVAAKVGGYLGSVFGEYLIKNHPATAKWIYDTFYKPDQVKAAAEKSKRIFDAAFAANKGDPNAFKDMLSGMDKAVTQAATYNAGQISKASRQALNELDPLTSAQENIKRYKDALTDLERQSKAGNYTPKLDATGQPINDVATKETIARYQALIEVQKRLADPVAQQLRDLQDQTREAQALTGVERNRWELEKALRDLTEQKGILTAKETDEIKKQVTELQKARTTQALANREFDLNQQIAGTARLTTLQRIELEINQEIAKFVRDQSDLTQDQIDIYRRKLTVLKETQAAQNLVDQLDPITAANREYQSQLQLLKSLNLSQSEYNRLKANLDEQTRASRDPLAQRLKEMREEIQVMSMHGRAASIEQKTLQDINSLRSQGVEVTDALADALKRYNTAMDEANRLSDVGIQHYIDSLGTFKEEFSKLQEQAASGFVDALIDGFSGGGLKASMSSFLRNLGKQMVSFAVKGIFRDIMKNFKLPDNGKNKAVSDAQKAAADIDKIRQSQMAKAEQLIQATQATVTAGTVYVNGQPLGTPGTPPAGTPAANTPITRQPLPNIPANANIPASSLPKLDPLGVFSSGKGDRVVKSPDTRIAEAFAASQPTAVATTKAATTAVTGFLNDHSKDLLAKVNPDLAKVVTNAQQYLPKGQTFQLADSTIRTLAQQQKYVAEGRSQTMHSNHLTGRAVDLNLYKNGKYSPNFEDYGAMADAMKRSAQDLGVPINWGGDWKTLKDGPHFELKRGFKGGSLKDMMGLPDTAPIPTQAPANVDTTMVTGSIQKVNQQLTTLGTTMQGMGQKVQTANPQLMQLGTQAQQTGVIVGTSGTGFMQAGQQVQQAGQVATAAGPQFTQAGTAIQQAGAAAASAGQQAQTAAPSMGGLGQGIGGLASQALSAIPGLGKFGGVIGNLISTLLSGLGGGGGGGGGGIGSIFTSIFGALFHNGGDVGTTRVPHRALPASAWAGAKRFHDGLANDEFTAILKRGERVLTASQANDNRRIMQELTNRVAGAQQSSNDNSSSARGKGITQNTTFNVTTKDANSFRKSQPQMATQLGLELRRMGSRNG